MEAQTLYSPRQLPDLEGNRLVLEWDQVGDVGIVRHGDTDVWREVKGGEVLARYEQIAAILKHRYGRRLMDLVPTPRSHDALCGDDLLGAMRVASVRGALGKKLPTRRKYFMVELAGAIRSGDGATIRGYLAQGGNPNAREDRGRGTLLHLAAQRRQPDIARALIASGAHVNAMDSQGRSPLFEALDDFFQQSGLPLAPYAYVVTSGLRPPSHPDRSTELVRILVGAGAHASGLTRPFRQLRGLVRETYRPPLALAAKRGLLDAMRCLLEHGAAVDAEDWAGATPLIEAVNAGQVEAARLLIAAGADVNHSYGPQAQTPLLRALYTAYGKDVMGDMVRLLIAAGADVNQPDADGMSPLLAALGTSRHDVLLMLLAAGADARHRDRHGNGALARYVWNKQGSQQPESEFVRWVETLRAAGADPAARNDEGKTARDLAREYGLTQLEKML